MPDPADSSLATLHGPVPRAPRWHRCVAWLLRNAYFRVRVVGAVVPPRPRQLVLSSHRNGAVDGYLVLAAFPHVNFLVAVQLLRNAFLRLMFAGIPVVRSRDTQRYGIARQGVAEPVCAALACLDAGGAVAVFPEGSSHWGPGPLRYQAGAARIACRTLAVGHALEVVPVGLFYRCPDRFRSRAEVLVGEPVELPARGALDQQAWERAVGQALASALDAVSVDCPDEATFARVEQLATQDSRDGSSYALAFKRREQQARSGRLEAPTAPASASAPGASRPRRLGPCAVAAALVMAPVLLVGHAVGRRADARHTTSFYRMAGGFAAAWLWLPALLAMGWRHPAWFPAAVALTVCGWWRWPED